MNKYFNRAIIGNGKILACLDDKAELIRLFYPNIDYYQNIHTYSLGFVFDGENKVYWFKDSEKVNQYYDGNIVYTKLKFSADNINKEYDIEVLIRDYALIEENVIVRKIKFSEPLSLMCFSKLNSSPERLVSGMCIMTSLIQYSQDTYFASVPCGSNILRSQINNVQKVLESADLKLEDYIGMSDNSAFLLEPKKEITLFISLEENLKDCTSKIDYLKKQNEEELFNSVKKYWREYLDKHLNYFIGNGKYSNKEIDIIERTILMYALLTNKETGAVLASPDVDENFMICGRYGFCWPRDALFINDAMILLGMEDIVNDFYSKWASITQLPNGLFEQRYYSNGQLAPSWGLQIDETASMIIGINKLKNKHDYAGIVSKATIGMIDFLDENFLSKPCYDLWEERRDSHLYSTASIYNALEASREILKDSRDCEHLICEIDLIQPKILSAIKNEFVEDNVLKRSKYNSITDISSLGASVPFGVFSANDEVVLNSVDKIEKELKTQNGGYLRYKDDLYYGGNPWIISSLWLALYYIEAGNKKKAQDIFDWVTMHADDKGFLPEQIDIDTGKTAWIVGLSWSHAMYIIVGKKLH